MDFYNDYELYIFDLDGTLYEDTSHFDYYGKLLREHLPSNLQEQFRNEYEQMKEGNHAVSIGKAYDVERDSILTLDPLTLKVIEVTDWNGSKWEQNKVDNTYVGKLTFDFEKMIAIGDGWWLPFVCAKHFGVKDTYNSYLQTKEYMVTDQFQLTKTPGLKQGLTKLKENKQIVLMTNSDAEDVGRLLKELDLDGIFEDVITSAMKPTKTTAFLNDLLTKYKVKPEQAVSIGDNFINEIAPALALGMNGLLIQAADVDVTHERLKTVKTLADAL